MDGKCVKGDVDNCMEYITDVPNTEVKCKQCTPDYYLVTGEKCVRGKIDNCLIMVNDSENECVKCRMGYFKLKMNL